ncbi:hypothetical protein F2Q69_00009377 [Brassica cretica]|uniref:Uncharacterized protein n=1 Tax=Brassica cretica TaxID=69181 RepID=A0A8S9P6M7_BRACR|nr:hypothetical protein F2Q69_00009377 [Brassica cretica]
MSDVGGQGQGLAGPPWILVLCRKGGGEGSSGNSSSSSNGKNNSTSEGNGGRANTVSGSMAVFGLIASLICAMF